MQDRAFDEVMIVNPYDPGSQLQGAKFMQFHYVPGYGYYQAPAGYGYYAAPDYANYGYYGQQFPPQPNEYGYVAVPQYGTVPEYQQYAEYPEYAEYPDQPGYPQYAGYPYAAYPTYAEYPEYAEYPDYAEYPEYSGYAPGYAEYPIYAQNPAATYAEYPTAPVPPEYAEVPPDYPQYAENPEMVGWGEAAPQEFDGYQRARSAPFNPGCMLPTNVNGYGEMGAMSGYMPPTTPNPTCNQFTGSATTPNVTDPFRPLF